MEGGPLSDPAFTAFAASVVLFVHNTATPPGQPVLADEKHPLLMREKGFNGFPTLCFMDADGSVIGKPGRSLRAFTEMLSLTRRLLELRGRGYHASEAEKKELFLVELQLDLIPSHLIQSRADAWRLDADEKALVEQKLVDVEVVGQDLMSEGAGAELAAIARAGRIPSLTTSGRFWQVVLEHASRHKDGELAQRAFDALMVRFAEESGTWINWRMAEWRKQLEASK